MRRHAAIIRGLFLAALMTGAQAQTPETEAGAVTAPAATNAVAAIKRDPFWPVGYAPVAAAKETVGATAAPSKTPVVAADTQDRLKQALAVSGIMRVGARYVARINGQLVGAGEKVTVHLDGTDYFFLVKDITKDAVRIDPIE